MEKDYKFETEFGDIIWYIYTKFDNWRELTPDRYQLYRNVTYDDICRMFIRLSNTNHYTNSNEYSTNNENNEEYSTNDSSDEEEN